MVWRGVLACTISVGAAATEAEMSVQTARAIESAYRCDRCTDAQYAYAARSLGSRRHVLFDFHAPVPRAYSVQKTTPAQKDAELAVAQVPVTAQERTRFDLSRRLWAAQGVVHFDEQELAGWNPTRDVSATACDIALTGALMKGFGLAVDDALWPATLPLNLPADARLMLCRGGDCNRLGPVKTNSVDHDVLITLGNGGTVHVAWPQGAAPQADEVRDARGTLLGLDCQP